jgi:hypothetical protein
MLVDTCITARGNGGGYCASHPSGIALDFGPVLPTRIEAVRDYAAREWMCADEEVRVRKSRGRFSCRYVAKRISRGE